MKNVNDSNQIGILLEFPADGHPLESNNISYWAPEFKNNILHHASELFPDVSITLNNEGKCSSVLFYKNDQQGRELTNNSLSLQDGVKIPRREVKQLQEAIEQLHQLSLDPNCAPATAEFLRSFRLPDPNAIPEAWRITERGKNLLVLWGYWRYSPNALFLPRSAVADTNNWKDNDKRRDLATRLKPFTTPFAPLPVKIILAILLVFLLLWGCPKCCSGKGKDKPAPTQTAIEEQEAKTNQGTTSPASTSQPNVNSDSTEKPPVASNATTPTPTATQLTQQLNDAVSDQSTPVQRAQAIQALEDLQKNGQPLSDNQRAIYQKLLLKNIQDDMDKLRRQIEEDDQAAAQAQKAQRTVDVQVNRQIQEVANADNVPPAIRQAIVQEEQRGDAIRQIRQRVAQNQATPTEQRLCQTLENQQKTNAKQEEDSRQRSEKIAQTISDLNKWRNKSAQQQGTMQNGNECPQCHFITAAFTPKVLSYSLTPDRFCEIKLQFTPTCNQVRGFSINYFKIGYLAFQRDFTWDPAMQTMTFRLKQSEIKDGKLRMLATASYVHAGQTLPAEFSLTLAISSTQKTTLSVDNVNIFAR